jgi:hypothetical protein
MAKKVEKKVTSLLMSIYKPSDDCRKSAAKLASKSCDKGRKGKNSKSCSTAGKVVGSRVANGKQGCKFYSSTKKK